ncbi:MAG: flagellar motor protein MotB [SAR324 cluster bacterium]|nr:flagellar motor protein MotB [SAR324 cluster bacterium]
MAQDHERSAPVLEETVQVPVKKEKKKKKSGNELDPNAWMVTFSDLITLMMTFFVLLYSFNDPNPKSQQSSLSSMEPGFFSMYESRSTDEIRILRANSILKESLEVFLSEHSVRNVELSQSDEGLIVTIPADIVFARNSALLSASAKQTIHQIARYLNKTGHMIRIEGHTDTTPVRSSKYRDSWDLSLARAQSVLKEMLNVGVSPAKLSLTGKGDSQPKASNQTPKGRRTNSRVEIVILNEND